MGGSFKSLKDMKKGGRRAERSKMLREKALQALEGGFEGLKGRLQAFKGFEGKASREAEKACSGSSL